jgi:hypothetical protein
MKQITLCRRVAACRTNHEPHLDDAPRLLPGLTRLAELLLTSRARGEDACERAVCVSDLSPFGLTLAEVRPLVTSGLVEVSPFCRMAGAVRAPSDRKLSSARKARGQRRSQTRPLDDRGNPREPKRSHLGPRTRLILTDVGLDYVTRQSRLLAAAAEGSTAGLAAASSDPSVPAQILPHYDIDARELNVAGVVVLCLPVQARNLAAVLSALQLSGWNRRVARPLSNSRGGNDPHHLANVALRLNRHQEMIDFRTDDGAICWRWRVP